MAKPILEHQSLDYSKPFLIELSAIGDDGMTHRVVKETYPTEVLRERRSKGRTTRIRMHVGTYTVRPAVVSTIGWPLFARSHNLSKQPSSQIH